MWELCIGVGIHVWYLCEKDFYKKSKEKSEKLIEKRYMILNKLRQDG
jgi:hypothetical protein